MITSHHGAGFADLSAGIDVESTLWFNGANVSGGTDGECTPWC